MHIPFFVGALTFELIGSSVLISVDCVSSANFLAVDVPIIVLQME